MKVRKGKGKGTYPSTAEFSCFIICLSIIIWTKKKCWREKIRGKSNEGKKAPMFLLKKKEKKWRILKQLTGCRRALWVNFSPFFRGRAEYDFNHCWISLCKRTSNRVCGEIDSVGGWRWQKPWWSTDDTLNRKYY